MRCLIFYGLGSQNFAISMWRKTQATHTRYTAFPGSDMTRRTWDGTELFRCKLFDFHGRSTVFLSSIQSVIDGLVYSSAFCLAASSSIQIWSCLSFWVDECIASMFLRVFKINQNVASLIFLSLAVWAKRAL